MDWISDIVKHITLSRTLTIAALITSTVLLFVPKYFPNSAVPAGWNWAVLAIFTFTISLTIFWILDTIRKLIHLGLRFIKNILPPPIPTPEEDQLLNILAQYADQTLNLETLYHGNQGKISKLKLLDLSKGLCKKGYVAEIFFDENKIYLTERGRRYALKLEKQQSKHNA
jgi:hypothetical protein